MPPLFGSLFSKASPNMCLTVNKPYDIISLHIVCNLGGNFKYLLYASLVCNRKEKKF